MTTHFGGPVDLVPERSGGPSEDMAFIRDTLAGLGKGGRGALRIYRPMPTAAFSRTDSVGPGYAEACAAVRAHGFEPALRPAGGRLAVYDSGAIVIDLVAPHPDPRANPMARFEALSEALKRALRALGVAAEVGPVPNEYCPGRYSLRADGRKIAGLAQRLSRDGYHLGAVMMFGPVRSAGQAMSAAYPALGLPLDPRTVGSISDLAPRLRCEDLIAAVSARLDDLIEVRRIECPADAPVA